MPLEDQAYIDNSLVGRALRPTFILHQAHTNRLPMALH